MIKRREYPVMSAVKVRAIIFIWFDNWKRLRNRW